jgi:transcriptional regulator with XRE-family HTH domain
MMKNIFCARIKELRISRNINQKQLGEAIGLSLQAISDIERGYRLTSMEGFVALADYFNVSLDYLVGRSDTPERR